jgi:hypothetical protein
MDVAQVGLDRLRPYAEHAATSGTPPISTVASKTRNSAGVNL